MKYNLYLTLFLTVNRQRRFISFLENEKSRNTYGATENTENRGKKLKYDT